ncbi:MAG: hypothetical protein GEEBNDBF_02586 [bacterium]|nr:hypothetical protein [bacterium]
MPPMAHTALFRRLTQLLKLAAKAPATSQATADDHGPILPRRQILQTGLALGAGAFFGAGCATSEGTGATYTNIEQSVIVIGAGIAGLHCAYRLRQAGVIAQVYEASERIGGRMWSDRSTFAGLVCERGGEFIDSGHETMLDLAQELGIALTDFDTDPEDLTPFTAYFNNAIQTPDELLLAFAPLAASIEDAYAEAETDAGFARLDALSLSEWLDEVGASGPIRKLLEVAYVIEYGLDANDTNCLNLIYLVGTDTTELSLFGESDERFHATEGNDQFPQRLAEGLQDGQITLGARLVALDRRADGRTRCFFERPGTSTLVVSVEHVVLAIPFSVLRSVENFLAFPPEKVAAIRDLAYGQNTKLMMGFASRLWRDQGATGETYSDAGYQCTWDTSRLQPGTAGILTNYTGGAPAVAIGQIAVAQAQAACLAQLEPVFNGLTDESTGTVLREYWPGNPLTRGSYSAYRPGQYSTISGLEIERFENVHFCGEHCSVDFQGYMEGGALTGAMAADEILSDLGRTGVGWVAGAPAARIMQRARSARQQQVLRMQRRRGVSV